MIIYKLNLLYIIYYSYLIKNYNTIKFYKNNYTVKNIFTKIYYNKYQNNIKYNYFYQKKENNILKIKNFNLKVELLIFISLYNYINYFKIHKYAQYLYNNKYLYKYLLLYNLINLNKKNFKNLIYSNIIINNNFKIYNRIIKYNFKSNKIKYCLYKYNNLENKIIIKIENSTLIKNIIYFFYFKILILTNFKNFNIKTLRITTLKKLFFLLYNIYLIYYEVKKIIIWNDLNINIYFYKKRNINFFKTIINLIKLNHIDLLFFKFFNEINFLKLNNKIKKLWIKSWLILKRNYIFNWSKVNSLTNKDITIWKLFYFNKGDNFFNIPKQLNIQKIENNKMQFNLNINNINNYIINKKLKLNKINLSFIKIFRNIIYTKKTKLNQNKKELYNVYNNYYINYFQYYKHNNNIIIIIMFINNIFKY